jgi:hypothetical protein
MLFNQLVSPICIITGNFCAGTDPDAYQPQGRFTVSVDAVTSFTVFKV